MNKGSLIQLYKAKEYVVKHTGRVGDAVGKVIARKWIWDIERESDKAKRQSNSESGKLESNDEIRVGMMVYSLTVGGGELFPIYLANALYDLNQFVVILNCNGSSDNKAVRNMIRPGIEVLDLNGYRDIPQYVKKYDLQILHSHHASVDLAVSRMILTGKINCKQVITLHGMYEALDKYRSDMITDRVKKTCSYFVYIADKNVESFKAKGEYESYKIKKIANGLPTGTFRQITRDELNIPKDAFVLCLVSRAIPEKGWKEAIQIVQELNHSSSREIHLILVGTGECYDELKKTKDRHIHFTGYQQNTRQYFEISDIGFLPSRYSGESFPLVIIDCLMCGKPVIASDLGEISNIIKADTIDSAGLVFELSGGRIPIHTVSLLIERAVVDKELYKKWCSNAEKLSLQYDIRKTAEAYLDVYKSCFIQYEQIPDIKIYISAHKPATMLHSKILCPIQVGCEVASVQYDGMEKDNTRDNISKKNGRYCELTAQYWAWKNTLTQYVGFFHYRRYLNLSGKRFPEDRYGNIYAPSLGRDGGRRFAEKYGLTDESITQYISAFDIVTAEKKKLYNTDGSPLSVREHYQRAKNLNGEDILILEKIIAEKTPEYVSYMNSYLSGNEGYFCNMYILKKEIFDDYCGWLFSILEEFEIRQDMSSYGKEMLRTPGHLSERMWGIYLTKIKMEKTYSIQEVQTIIVANTDHISGIKKYMPLDELKIINHKLSNGI